LECGGEAAAFNRRTMNAAAPFIVHRSSFIVRLGG